MLATELLAARASNGKLTDPAPEGEERARILADALRAPDHGAVRPWTILTVEGEARAKLGELFARALRASDPEATEEQVTRLAGKPLRAPLIFVVAASVRAHPKAPEIEQVLSAGAVAHGLLLSLQARGYAGFWRTGPMAYSDVVKEGLGLAPSDHIVAFLYAGTPSVAPPAMPRPTPADVTRPWTGA